MGEKYLPILVVAAVLTGGLAVFIFFPLYKKIAKPILNFLDTPFIRFAKKLFSLASWILAKKHMIEMMMEKIKPYLQVHNDEVSV